MQLSIHVEGDNCWPDLVKQLDRPIGEIVSIARLPYGTLAGKTTVTVRLAMPDGTVVLGQTTLQMLNAALAAFNQAEVLSIEEGWNKGG